MKRRVKYFIMIMVALILVIGLIIFSNLYTVFLSPLDVGIDIDKNYGDVILVLGGGLRKGLEIGYSSEERLILAIELFHRKNRTIIISDGSLYPRSPAIKKFTDFLVKRGVPKHYIQIEGKSQTTFDNFFYTQQMIDKMKSREVIVCTSPYHQRRARIILNYLKLENFKIARMKKSEIYHPNSVSQRSRNLWLILREYLAIVKFKIFKE